MEHHIEETSRMIYYNLLDRFVCDFLNKKKTIYAQVHLYHRTVILIIKIASRRSSREVLLTIAWLLIEIGCFYLIYSFKGIRYQGIQFFVIDVTDQLEMF